MQHLDSIKTDLLKNGYARCPASKTLLELEDVATDLGLYASELTVGYDKGELLLQVTTSPRYTLWVEGHEVDN